jgi:hypothetical protein
VLGSEGRKEGYLYLDSSCETSILIFNAIVFETKNKVLPLIQKKNHLRQKKYIKNGTTIGILSV